MWTDDFVHKSSHNKSTKIYWTIIVRFIPGLSTCFVLLHMIELWPILWWRHARKTKLRNRHLTSNHSYQSMMNTYHRHPASYHSLSNEEYDYSMSVGWLLKEGHPSSKWTGPTLLNFVDQDQLYISLTTQPTVTVEFVTILALIPESLGHAKRFYWLNQLGSQ